MGVPPVITILGFSYGFPMFFSVFLWFSTVNHLFWVPRWLWKPSISGAFPPCHLWPPRCVQTSRRLPGPRHNEYQPTNLSEARREFPEVVAWPKCSGWILMDLSCFIQMIYHYIIWIMIIYGFIQMNHNFHDLHWWLYNMYSWWPLFMIVIYPEQCSLGCDEILLFYLRDHPNGQGLNQQCLAFVVFFEQPSKLRLFFWAQNDSWFVKDTYIHTSTNSLVAQAKAVENHLGTAYTILL